MVHPDRLLPADPGVRDIARRLYDHTASLPIVSPHGHCDPWSFAENQPLGEPAAVLVTADHYLLRMLYSQGVPLEQLGLRTNPKQPAVADREIWRTFAEHYPLFRGTPSKGWLDHTLCKVFGIDHPLTAATADAAYDRMVDALTSDEFRPRALYDRFGIEMLATTDHALSSLEAHRLVAKNDWGGVVVPTFRPDAIVDPDNREFVTNLARLGELTGTDTSTWSGYLDAIRVRRREFIDAGATASDHGHPTATTADLSDRDAAALFAKVVSGNGNAADHELFRGQMLVEMAALSLEDGLVLQLHTGSWRDHNPTLSGRFGADVGADIPTAAGYVASLKPLLDRFGNDPSLTVVVYTLDEGTYSRELAPLAGHYPALKLGPPWWFHDSPAGIRRFRREVTGTAGFANTVGFNDDARSLLTIPARHDMSRRVDAGFIAELVAEHVLDETEAFEVATDLAYRLARRTFVW